MTDRTQDTQLERTALAQNRTGLATLVLSLALLRFATFRGSMVGTVLSVLAGIVSLVELYVSRTSYRTRDLDDPRPRRLGAALVSAAAVSVIAVAGLVIALA